MGVTCKIDYCAELQKYKFSNIINLASKPKAEKTIPCPKGCGNFYVDFHEAYRKHVAICTGPKRKRRRNAKIIKPKLKLKPMLKFRGDALSRKGFRKHKSLKSKNKSISKKKKQAGVKKEKSNFSSIFAKTKGLKRKANFEYPLAKRSKREILQKIDEMDLDSLVLCFREGERLKTIKRTLDKADLYTLLENLKFFKFVVGDSKIEDLTFLEQIELNSSETVKLNKLFDTILSPSLIRQIRDKIQASKDASESSENKASKDVSDSSKTNASKCESESSRIEASKDSSEQSSETKYTPIVKVGENYYDSDGLVAFTDLHEIPKNLKKVEDTINFLWSVSENWEQNKSSLPPWWNDIEGLKFEDALKVLVASTYKGHFGNTIIPTPQTPFFNIDVWFSDSIMTSWIMRLRKYCILKDNETIIVTSDIHPYVDGIRTETDAEKLSQRKEIIIQIVNAAIRDAKLSGKTVKRIIFVSNACGCHWNFTAVDLIQNTLEFYDSLSEFKCLKYVYIVKDGKQKRRLVSNLKLDLLFLFQFLQKLSAGKVAGSKLQGKFARTRKEWTIKSVPLKLQEDAVSCGPFVCLLLEAFLMGESLQLLSQSIVRYFVRFRIFILLALNK